MQPGALLEDGAIVCDGAVVERGATVQAGAVVPSGTTVPALSIWGSNGVVGHITEDDLTARADANVAAVESDADELRLEYPDGNLLCVYTHSRLVPASHAAPAGTSAPETSKPAQSTLRRPPGMTLPSTIATMLLMAAWEADGFIAFVIAKTIEPPALNVPEVNDTVST